MILPPILLAGAVLGWRQVEFSGENCFIDISKEQSTFVPDIDWRWDCEIDFSVLFERPESAEPPARTNEYDRCDFLPNERRVVEEKLIQKKNGEVVSIDTNIVD